MPEITETKLKEQIAKEQIGSLYFLYGDEKLLVRRNLNRLLKKLDGNFPEFNFQEFPHDAPVDSIADAVVAMPFMAERKCVTVSDLNVEAMNTAELDKLYELLDTIPETTVLIIYLPTLEIDPKKSAKWRTFLKKLDTRGFSLPSLRLKDNELEKYVCREAEKANCLLSRKLAEARKTGELTWLRPDGKSQVTVEYDDDGRVLRCPAIVVSTQHDPDIALKDLREAIVETIIKPVIPTEYIDRETKFYVNPTGRFVVGGPVGDTGLTGRKIIVDTYGGSAAHGGGCFSGKDPTKVDRSAAYMARYVAKNIVAAGLARKCQIELAYAIGVAHPVSVLVDTYGTGVLSEEKLSAIVNECFDLRPAKIIEHLDLRRPIYEQTAAYGHFGRTDIDLPWEHTDMVEKLKSYR